MYTIIPSAIPVMIDIPRISLILLRKKNTVLNMAINAANKISSAAILESKYVMAVKTAVITTVRIENLIILSLS